MVYAQSVPVIACIALGSNIGDRASALDAAFARLATLPECVLIARSEPVETEPVGPVPQGIFLNAAAVIETTLPPRDLLEAILAIESAGGRDRSRTERWGPRTIDLDLLLYGDRIIAEPGLMVPHPRMHQRRFVLEPLSAIAPDALHPVLMRTVREMLEDLPTED